jgi:hypothetical protein
MESTTRLKPRQKIIIGRKLFLSADVSYDCYNVAALLTIAALSLQSSPAIPIFMIPQTNKTTDTRRSALARCLNFSFFLPFTIMRKNKRLEH